MNRRSYAKDFLNWIDLETTGLDPEKDEILEVALIVTDGMHNPIMIKKAVPVEVSLVVRHDPNKLRMTRWAWETHQQLLAECFYGRASSIEHVDLAISSAIDEAGSRGCPLAGSSPHFDERFIRRYMPLTHKYLGYQHYDVSTLLMNADTRGIEIVDETDAPHRALGDLKRSIRRAKLFNQATGEDR